MEGLPWPDLFRIDDINPYTNYSGDISYFAKPNFPIQVLDGNKVSFRYKFKDFYGTTTVFAGWEARIETTCQSVTRDSVPLITPGRLTGSGNLYQWIYPSAQILNGSTGLEYSDVSQVSSVRNGTIQICKSDAGNYTLVNNCSY